MEGEYLKMSITPSKIHDDLSSQLNTLNFNREELSSSDCGLHTNFACESLSKTPPLSKNSKEILSSLLSSAQEEQTQLENVEKHVPTTPLPREPQLEKPLEPLAFDIPRSKNVQKNEPSLTQEEFDLVLQQMSSKSLEDIVSSICTSQLDLEHIHAKTVETTHTRYLAFQKTQQRLLQDIQNILMQDEKVLSHLKTGQAVALTASFLAGIAAAAVSLGLLAPAAAAIGQIAGASAAAMFVSAATTISTVGPAATASLSGLTTVSKMYIQHQTNEHRAEGEERQHNERYLNERLEDTRNRLSTIAETDEAFKDHWHKLSKRLRIMLKIILRK